MCLCGSRESLAQYAEGRTVVVYEGVWNARLVEYMYESSMTGLRCAVGVTDGFKVQVGLHKGSAPSPFLLW